MHNHEQARKDHRDRSIHAMSKENNPEGRLRAFLKTQQDHFDDRINALSVSDEIKSALKSELSIYRNETDEIVSTIVHGVKA